MNLSSLLGAILPGTFNFLEQVVGPYAGSTKFDGAIRIAKLAAMIAAESGLIAVGEAHDEANIVSTVQTHFNEVKASGQLQRLSKPPLASQISPPADLAQPEHDPNKPITDPVKVRAIYDKHAQPPLTVPPAGLEEERGVVFIPPPPDAPLHQQSPDPGQDRPFVTPDPLMRSAPVASGPMTPTSLSPTTNIGPGEVNVNAGVNEANKTRTQQEAQQGMQQQKQPTVPGPRLIKTNDQWQVGAATKTPEMETQQKATSNAEIARATLERMVASQKAKEEKK